jgi:CO/xanthine dehydrogenase FAD-binding subunit
MNSPPRRRSSVRTFEYLKPTSVEEALQLLARHRDKAKIIAGGTDVMIQWKRRIISPEYLVSLRNIRELNFLDFSDGARIGSATSHRALELSPEIRQIYPVIHDAVSNLGSMQVRNSATIGGNICNAAPSADTAPPLLVLDAVVKVVSQKDERLVAIEDFFSGPGRTVLQPGELVTEFRLSQPLPLTGMAYWKHTRRRAMDLPILGIAALLTFDADFKSCRKARIALGVAGPTPMRARKAEEHLLGKTIDEAVLGEAGLIASQEAAPRTTIRGSGWYRKQMIQVLVRRTGLICLERAKRKAS